MTHIQLSGMKQKPLMPGFCIWEVLRNTKYLIQKIIFDYLFIYPACIIFINKAAKLTNIPSIFQYIIAFWWNNNSVSPICMKKCSLSDILSFSVSKTLKFTYAIFVNIGP